MHSLDINKYDLDVVEALPNYQSRYVLFKEKCYAYLDEDAQNQTEELFNGYFNDEKMRSFKPVVIHGDLSTDHILITNDGIGIIDFGDTRVFDYAYDFQWLYLLDRKELDKTLELYKYGIDDYFYKRITFYISIIPYYGIVYALETNDNKMLEEKINRVKNGID